MLHRLRPVRLLLPTLLVLALPLVASADDPADAAGDEVRRPLARSRSVGEPGSNRPSALFPVQGLHAQAFPTASLGVWAAGHGFALSRRVALYDLEGGASWRIDDGVHLTASYRMLGLDLGFDSDVEGADGGPGIAAPFIGVAFDF